MSPDQSDASSPSSSSGGSPTPPTHISLREWVIANSFTIRVEAPDPAAQEERIKRQLRQEIVMLWKRVWLGIYRLEGLHGLTHSYCLRRLYIGAGLEIDLWESPMEQGTANTREYGWNSGVYYLKLYNNVSIATLGAVVDLMTEYGTQVAAVDRAYELLERHQRDAYVDAASGIRFRAPEPNLQVEWSRLSAALRDNLWQFQLRTGVMNQLIFDEAVRLHRQNPTRALRGWFVRERAFPNGRR
ncbi:hypothetical protein P168DRAFT_305472 [Aspergillus campestris IBT 28561]|uniref:Uncharacterized protein n=1 Tax=Aspergillus campestris (strain IBT 28561) TaxID=1392248 RepID=A0A2I1CZS9_ASPC2|nr:uncharacterized protein P168DRAFT_305472 [Aspergillus campestris IBT 28561]PKY03142.1 hypothetical protein P168DRAFT_305472 [Aspergillus campestris IBT 28561]